MVKHFLILTFILCSFKAWSLEESSYFQKVSHSGPVRDISVIATKEGFYPKVLTSFKGERVNFFVTSTTERESCFMLTEKNVFVPAAKGSVSEASVVFDRPGVYKFHCPTGNLQGRIVVLEKKSELEKKKVKRKLASDGPVRIWRPREE
jgi:plastocyanin